MARAAFFKKQKKTAEQRLAERRLMWVHQKTKYLTYVDIVRMEADDKKLRALDVIYFEGPHSTGIGKPGGRLKVIDNLGETIGLVEILSWVATEQHTFEGSLHMGLYLKMNARILEGEKKAFRAASILADPDLPEYVDSTH